MMKHSLTLTPFLFLALSMPARAAGVFEITNIDYDGIPDVAKDALDEAFAAMEAQVNASLPDTEPGDYTKGMANAVAMAGTGTSAVYGSSYRYGLIGVGIGLGLDLGDQTIGGVLGGDAELDKIGGLGLQGAAVLGLNPGAFTSGTWFGIIDPSRLRTYLSFMSLSRDVGDAAVEFSNFGAVAQYRIIPEQSLGMNVVKWNGVDVSAGLRYSKMKFVLTQTVSESQDVDGGGQMEISGPITVGADVGIFTVPLEASTSVRLLYVLNLVGGMGADLNFGSSKAIANLDADIEITGVPGGSPTAEGDLDLGGAAGPTIMNLRGFMGVQFEFAIGSLYATVQKSLTASVWGVNTGVNFFF
jgi:hypothetical protein